MDRGAWWIAVHGVAAAAAAAAKSLQSCPTHERRRLPCPWDSIGKNSGVGCHVLLQCRTVKSKSEVAHRV